MMSNVETTENLEVILDQIIHDLDTAHRKLPEQAIALARKHRAEIIPRLIRVIREATASAASGDVPEGRGHFFALFLLTEFQAKEALPAILEAVSLPGELLFDLFGDAITETLCRIFAALAGENLAWLDDLIQDRSLNEYVRWGAAETFLLLVRDGRLTRDDVVDRLRRHLRNAIAGNDIEIVDGLVFELTSYSPHEAADDIREAFRLDLVDYSMIVPEDIEQSLKEGESRFQQVLGKCRPTGIRDTVEELSTWAAFRNQSDDFISTEDDYDSEEDDGEPFDIGDAIPPVRTAPQSVRNTEPHVGRNDPCPCGSGKKFKKCCLYG